MISDPEQSLPYVELSRSAAALHGYNAILPHSYTTLTVANEAMGNLIQAKHCGETSLSLSREYGNFSEEGDILGQLGWIEHMLGNPDQALQRFKQTQNIWFKHQDFDYMAWMVAERTWVAWSQGDLQKVLLLCEELEVFDKNLDSKCFGLYAIWFHAWVEWAQGLYTHAEQLCKEIIPSGNIYLHSWNVIFMYVLGRVELSLGNFFEAEQCFRQVDEMADAPRWRWKALGLHGFGLLAAAQASERPELAERAAILFGAQAQLFAWLPVVLSPIELNEYHHALAQVRTALGEESFNAAWARGQNMTWQQVFAYALENS